MSGIAILAKKTGHTVTGSDRTAYDPIKSVLDRHNIKVTIGHKIKDIKNKDLIIIGNIMSRGNPVIEHILKNELSYTSGPEWLSKNILKNKQVIAISGTHGKTTTTTMIAHIMNKLGLNPSYLIGGDPSGTMNSVKLTKSKYFILEADEYDTAFFDKRSKFIHYNPNILVINNIEFDHADIFKNIDDIKKSFHHLIRLIPSNGKIIFNSNDRNIKDLLKLGTWSKLISINTKKTIADYNLEKSSFYKLKIKNKTYALPGNLIGHHNYINAVFALAACNQISNKITKQIESLKSYKGVKKRMEFIDKINNIEIYDDFAHHPTAIKAAIDSIKNRYKNKKLLTIFLPNSNSINLGVHNDNLSSSLKHSNFVLVITHNKKLLKYFSNNIKINVIECESQIGDYLSNISKFDNILILSNKNTKNVIKYIKNEL
ncbi:MAG: UDP-N-acetylmuramate:L-alanyl-gamma-D-glutamyl-meso-diaminopimelate ligase [Gammaproteobacteria bacterium]|nr:UDP-N-acetylmuramate:L-alanyl-gamma-D-glutamyl-meso-diaminopimelate ligase [Gammaproteobacteria bacterium]MBL6898600.1 UDP-N-acetylmuramate:L-alanyl-gamma-D-glutamyl-meso-diaminopimelate ligase [Gammaproteobacteria bacterium]